MELICNVKIAKGNLGKIILGKSPLFKLSRTRASGKDSAPHATVALCVKPEYMTHYLGVEYGTALLSLPEKRFATGVTSQSTAVNVTVRHRRYTSLFFITRTTLGNPLSFRYMKKLYTEGRKAANKVVHYKTGEYDLLQAKRIQYPGVPPSRTGLTRNPVVKQKLKQLQLDVANKIHAVLAKELFRGINFKDLTPAKIMKNAIFFPQYAKIMNWMINEYKRAVQDVTPMDKIKQSAWRGYRLSQLLRAGRKDLGHLKYHGYYIRTI